MVLIIKIEPFAFPPKDIAKRRKRICTSRYDQRQMSLTIFSPTPVAGEAKFPRPLTDVCASSDAGGGPVAGMARPSPAAQAGFFRDACPDVFCGFVVFV